MSIVAKTGNKVNCCPYGQLNCWYVDFVAVLATNPQQREFNSLSWSTLLPIQSTLLPIQSTLSPVCTGPKPHGRLSAKSTVLNSTSPVCTGLKAVTMETESSFRCKHFCQKLRLAEQLKRSCPCNCMLFKRWNIDKKIQITFIRKSNDVVFLSDYISKSLTGQ